MAKKAALGENELIRTELEATLKLVAPALSDRELIPVLTHFWFRGDRVMAFNDQIAIETGLKTNFTGAVPGRLLLEFLGMSKAAKASFTLTDDNLEVKLSRAKMTLKTLPIEEFIFKIPKHDKEGGIKGSDKFVPAIECCMQSISNDTSIPDQLGMTIVPNGKDLYMYATDNHTLSHAKVRVETTLPGRVILSKPFCEQLVELTKNKEPFRLIVQEDCALAVIDGGRTHLFGRLIDSSHPLDFDEILDQHLAEGAKKKMVMMPKSLKQVLQRALLITDTKMEETKSLITMKKGQMIVHSKSALGELEDKVYDEKDWMVKHPDVSVRLNPRLLKVGHELYEKLLVTDSCAVMTKGDMVYLVSASSD